MSRSIWKPTYIHPEIISQFESKDNSTEIIIFNRSTQITEEFIGRQVSVYNGIRFFSFEVDNEKIGHCFGEFAPTKKKPIAKRKKEKKKKK